MSAAASTWNRADVPSVPALYSVAVADGGLVFASGAQGFVARSTDGGASFSPAGRIVGFIPSLWCSSDGARLFAACEGGGVLLSTDRGATFSQARSRAQHVHGLGGSGDEIVVTGIRGLAQRSTDAGATFKALKSGVTDFLLAAGVDGEGGVYLLGMGFLLSSRDHGATFKAKRLRSKVYLRAVAAFPDGSAVVVGDGGRVLITRDRGASWADQGATGLPSMHGLWGPSPDRLWAVGEGRIYRSDDVGESWRLEHEAPGVRLEAIAGRPGGPVVAVGGQMALARELG